MSGEASASYLSRYHRLALGSGMTVSVAPPPGAGSDYIAQYFAGADAGLRTVLGRAASQVARLVATRAGDLGLLVLPDQVELTGAPRALDWPELTGDTDGLFTGEFPRAVPTAGDVREALRDDSPESKAAVDQMLREMKHAGLRPSRIEGPTALCIKASLAHHRRMLFTVYIERPVRREALAELVRGVVEALAAPGRGERDGLVELPAGALVESWFKLTCPVAPLWVDQASADLFRDLRAARALSLAADVRAALAPLASPAGQPPRLAAYDASLENPGILGRLLPGRRRLVRIDLEKEGWPGILSAAVIGSAAAAESVLRRALAPLTAPRAPADR